MIKSLAIQYINNIKNTVSLKGQNSLPTKSYPTDSFEESPERKNMIKTIEKIEKGINDKNTSLKFTYPDSFKQEVLKDKNFNIQDWVILSTENYIIEIKQKIQDLYKVDNLLPFAKHDDSTCFACFDVNDNSKVKLVTLYAPDEYFYSDEFEDFQAWKDYVNREEE